MSTPVFSNPSLTEQTAGGRQPQAWVRDAGHDKLSPQAAASLGLGRAALGWPLLGPSTGYLAGPHLGQGSSRWIHCLGPPLPHQHNSLATKETSHCKAGEGLILSKGAQEDTATLSSHEGLRPPLPFCLAPHERVTRTLVAPLPCFIRSPWCQERCAGGRCGGK